MNKEIELLSKDKSLVNLANSILKFYGCETYHDSIKEIDEVLAKTKKKKICLFLFDGFGEHILEKHKESAPYMYAHRFLKMKSVYPCTTVAATTAILTGRYPIENGYMGWNQYFDKYQDICTVFLSKRLLTDEKITPNIQEDVLKTWFITDDINKKLNDDTAKIIMSFKVGDDARFPRIVHKLWEYKVDKAINENRFVYAYNVYPDHAMHHYGTTHKKVVAAVKRINKTVEKLTKKHPDTLFMAISDHGMKDIEFIDFNTIEGFADLLARPYLALESRFAMFWVKDKEKFEELYKNTPFLNDNFNLLNKEEILSKNIFGYTTNPNEISMQTIGDYLLIARDKYGVTSTEGLKIGFKGHHAGMTKDETDIYLQLYNE